MAQKKTVKVKVLSVTFNPKLKFGEVIELPDNDETRKLVSEGYVEEVDK